MGTLYNPNGLTTNCGFCSIAHGLFLQGTKTDADKLYLQTIERLGLTLEGGRDPIPRQLIFPQPIMDGLPLPTGYSALGDRGHGPASYTITAVASAHNLRYQPKITALDLPRTFFAFYSRQAVSDWNVADFVDMRLEYLHSQGSRITPGALRQHVLGELGGDSIVGSAKANHFINVHIDRDGHITALDAQDGRSYTGAGLYERLRGSVDLFMHLR